MRTNSIEMQNYFSHRVYLTMSVSILDHIQHVNFDFIILTF